MNDGSAHPKAIGAPAMPALHRAGVTRLDRLRTMSERDLLALHGVGPGAIRILTAALAEQGWTCGPGEAVKGDPEAMRH